jgi:hypothetical protein
MSQIIEVVERYIIPDFPTLDYPKRMVCPWKQIGVACKSIY